VGEGVVGVGGGEVADAGADVEGEGAGVGEAVEGEAFAGVVGYLDADGDPGDILADVFAGFDEGGGGDVYGLVDDASLLAHGGGEEDAGLGGGARAEFDDGEDGGGVVARGERGLGDDFVGVGGEDAALGAGEVVLRKLGDLLEEVGTGFVVEEPWRERFRGRGETCASFCGYCPDGAGGGDEFRSWAGEFRDR